MSTHPADSFVKNYLAALREENAAVFAGAGLSIPTGLVDWHTLLRDIASDIQLDVDRESDLVSVAQFHVNERGGRHRINQALVTEFAERATLSENHSLLAALPIKTYWTTNYDSLIEQALRAAHKRPDVKHTTANLATTLPRRDAVVYKMHGDVTQPDTAIVTRDDYEAYAETHRLFSIALQGDLVSKTFLFIGFSFSDPNLSFILARIRLLLGQNRREHYCLLRRVSPNDFTTNAEFDYARARQDLQVRDLRRYGIIGVLVDNYEDYTALLRRLVSAYRRDRVFVSGSAASFEPWTESAAHLFLRNLGENLIRNGLDLISGFGHGVGSSLINGALNALDRDGSLSLGERLVLRPFPQVFDDAAERARRWTAYRQEMIGHAGIAIFVFGNRRATDGSLQEAAGVAEEFDLAQRAGLALVPIGGTGYEAARLHQRVLDNFELYYPHQSDLRPAFEALGTATDPSSVLQSVVDFLTKLRRER